MMQQLESLAERYIKLHHKLADGCKESCGRVEFGMLREHRFTTLDSVQKYFFRFGGYCIGDCHRLEERENSDPDKLFIEVSRIFNMAEEDK